MTNITLRIDDSLAQDAKVYAAQRGISLSKLVSMELEKLVDRGVRYNAAKAEAINAIREAEPIGYKGVNRESLYDR